MINKICIIGSGNIGMALAVELAQNVKAEITLVSTKPHLFSKRLLSVDAASGKTTHCDLTLVTDNYDTALENADLVFIAIPVFLFPKIINKIKINRNCIIGLVPGIGGREFYCDQFIGQGNTVFGMDRVPFVARIIEYGVSVSVSKKKQIRIAAWHQEDTDNIITIISDMLNIECLPLKNYLTVTLTPSNPILHTARLYTLFKDMNIDLTLKKQIAFYAEWNHSSSAVLLAADEELQSICKKYYPMDLSDVISLKIHYESNTALEMTNKITSIQSLKDINAPLILQNGEYIIDRQSRYFIEDFPYGLCVIKNFADIAAVKTPMIDTMLRWFESFFVLNYFEQDQFIGKDLQATSMPRNFGIHSVNDVIKYYTGG
jgi:hypothetical protein